MGRSGGMRQHGDIGRDLATAYPCGRIERDGETVGVWYVTKASGTDSRVARLWRDAEGRHCGEGVWASPGPLVASAARVQGSFGRDFGFHLHDLLAGAGALPGAMRGKVDLVRDAGETVRQWLPGTTREDSEAMADAALRPALREAAAPYLAGLDPDAMELFLRHPEQRWWLGEHWDALDDTVGDAPLAAALRLHPGFARTVCNLVDAAGRDGLSRLLDQGRLWDFILLEGRKRHVARPAMEVARRAEAALADAAAPYPALAFASREDDRPTLEGLFAQRPGDVEWPVAMAGWAARFPRDWEPRTPAGWWAFARLVPVMQAVEAEHGRVGRMDRLLPSGGDWEATLARVVSASGLLDARDGAPSRLRPTTARAVSAALVRAVSDTRDMAAAYARQALAPALLAEGCDPSPPDPELRRLKCAALGILAGGRSLARVLELSADWHRRSGTMAAALASLPGGGAAGYSWDPGIPAARRGGVDVVPLADTAALAAEGAKGPDARGMPGLGNCLAGYGEDCLSGRVRVVSLRGLDLGGRMARLSAAELSLTSSEPFRVLQHAGPGNGPAPADAEAALESYVEDLRSGVLPSDGRAFAPMDTPRIPAHVRACGFDPAVATTRVAVARMWDRYVPKPSRDLDAAAVRAALAAYGTAGGWPAMGPPAGGWAPRDDGPTPGP